MINIFPQADKIPVSCVKMICFTIIGIIVMLFGMHWLDKKSGDKVKIVKK